MKGSELWAKLWVQWVWAFGAVNGEQLLQGSAVPKMLLSCCLWLFAATWKWRQLQRSNFLKPKLQAPSWSQIIGIEILWNECWLHGALISLAWAFNLGNFNETCLAFSLCLSVCGLSVNFKNLSSAGRTWRIRNSVNRLLVGATHLVYFNIIQSPPLSCLDFQVPLVFLPWKNVEKRAWRHRVVSLRMCDVKISFSRLNSSEGGGGVLLKLQPESLQFFTDSSRCGRWSWLPYVT